MATTKVTFTLDDLTVARLRDAAARLSKPQSQVVREAIEDFHDRIGILSEGERRRLLKAFDQLTPRIPYQPASEVEREIQAIRAARRGGGVAGKSRRRTRRGPTTRP
jgi:hypothetical protein